MSIEALNWAIRAAAPDPSSKLILILLANYANHDGQAWPSLTTLATQSGLDRRTVMRKIGELIDAKLIEKTVNRRPNRLHDPTVYTLKGRGTTPLRVGAPRPQGRGTVPPEPSLNLKEPLPPGWGPNDVALREMKERYPELDLNASTDRFTAHFTSKGTRNTDDGWIHRWKTWISEDGSNPRRTKRTATRLTRAQRIKLENTRKIAETRARLATLSNDVADWIGQD